jgi:hypothetical protein
MAATENLRRLAKTVLRQPEWILALTVSLAVVWLHFYFLLHAGGFWRDEVNLINLSGHHSLIEMSRDSFPVLMPLLVSGWTAIGLGQNDLILRLLGTLIGLALPAALWLAIWKIRRAPPLIGLVLLALNSTVIIYGDSLRAFGLGSALILLTTAAAVWFLRNPTWRRTGFFATLAILSVQALYQNTVLIAAICFGAWAVCARQKNGCAALKICSVAAISAASLLPYWVRILSLPDAAGALRTGFDPVKALASMNHAMGFPLEEYFWVWGFLALMVAVCAGATFFHRKPESGAVRVEYLPTASRSTIAVALAASFGFIWFAASPQKHWCYFPLLALIILGMDAGWFRSWRFHNSARIKSAVATPTGDAWNRDLPLFAGATLLMAVAGFAGFLWFAALATKPWYFLPLMSLAAVCIETGLTSGRHARAAIVGFAILTMIGAFPFAFRDLNWRFTNVDLVAQRLTNEAGPDDFIIVSPWYCGITFNHYYKGPASWSTLPPLKDHSMHRFDLVREQIQKQGVIQPVFTQIAATLQSGHRVWIVGTMDIPKAGTRMPPDLPPAPANFSGSDLRFTQNWTYQVAQFLSNHAGRFYDEYYTTNQSVNFEENMKLRLAEGWQDSTDIDVPSNPQHIRLPPKD